MCVECALTVKSVPSFRRKVYLWNEADFTVIKELVTQFANSFLENTIDTPIQDLWDAYKTMCLNCLQLVPTKSVPTGKCNQPWATPFIRRLSSKKWRLYNRARRSDLLEDWKNITLLKNLRRRNVEKRITDICVTCSILTLIELTRTCGHM